MLVPFIALFHPGDIKKITGTALIVQLFAATGNILGRLFLGSGLPLSAIYLVTGAVLGAYAGARFAKGLKPQILTTLSTSVLLIVVIHSWFTAL